MHPVDVCAEAEDVQAQLQGFECEESVIGALAELTLEVASPAPGWEGLQAEGAVLEEPLQELLLERAAMREMRGRLEQ